MKVEAAGALAARLAGVMLIILAVSMSLPWILLPCASTDMSAGATAGWTSYPSPESSTNSLESIPPGLDDAYYVVDMTFDWLPLVYVLISAFGVVMIVFSKPLGRLLTRGLGE
jgi:ABC-type uncharacterized transport system permease subunit